MDFTVVLKQLDATIWDSRIKLVRHADSRFDLDRILKSGFFPEYEARQSRPVFHGVDYILSFFGERGTRSRFLGCSRIRQQSEGSKPWPSGYPYPDMNPGGFHYDLELLPQFDEMRDRLVIDWGNATRSWAQHLRPKELLEIRSRGFVTEFPGFDEAMLEFQQLDAIVRNPDANGVWFRTLSSVAGVYLIVDTETGNQYVGSAYGAEGIFGRWAQYARSKHGGNKRLVELLREHPERWRRFQFSILRTLPKTMTAAEVIEVESLKKRKLGSRAFGLNSN